MAQSDREVELRLSNFCPADFRENMTASQRVSASSPRSQRTSADSSHRRSSARSSAQSSRLHAVCMELVETEQRYHRDLSLIVHTFVQGLRRVAPQLIQPLVSNAEQV